MAERLKQITRMRSGRMRSIRKQIGTAMDDHAYLAGTGTRQHQEVALRRRGNNLFLRVIVQALDDRRIALLRRGSLEHLRVVSEVVPSELERRHREIVLYVASPVVESVPCFVHVASHRMDLAHALVVMVLERAVMLAGVAPALRLVQKPNGHGLAENRQPLLELDDVVLVQEQERLLDGVERVLDLMPQLELPVDGVPDIFQREPNEPFAALREQLLAQVGRCGIQDAGLGLLVQRETIAEPLGHIPPAEFEQGHYQNQPSGVVEVGLN